MSPRIPLRVGSESRTWSWREAATATILLVALSWGFIALFPYDPVVLGPLTGVGGFTALLIACVAIVWWALMRPRHSPLTDVVGVTLFAALLLSIAVVRVHWTPGIDPLADRDEALSVAWTGLVNGQGPYSSPTPLGNPISPLVGGVLIFAPFEILQLNEFFDVVAFALTAFLLIWFCSWRPALAMLSLLLFSVAFRWEVMIQSDAWINAIAVAGSCLWAVDHLRKSDDSRNSKVLLFVATCSVVLTLSYRAHFALVLVPIAVVCWKSISHGRVLAWLSVVAMGTLLLSLVPIVVWPSPYGPQHVSEFLHLGEFWLVALCVAVVLALVLMFALLRLQTMQGALLWTAFALLSGLLIMGLSSLDWSLIATSPLNALTAYPPALLKPFGTYALTANNGGILAIGLLALVLPQYRSSDLTCSSS